MSMIKYNSLQDTMPTSIGMMLDRIFNDTITTKTAKFSPSVDIAENSEAYEIHVAVPGMKKENFKIDLTDGRLTISGERKFEEIKKDKNYHSVETQFGAFSRSFYIPDDVNIEKISASYQEGILQINLPKDQKRVKSTQISIA